MRRVTVDADTTFQYGGNKRGGVGKGGKIKGGLEHKDIY